MHSYKGQIALGLAAYDFTGLSDSELLAAEDFTGKWRTILGS